MRRATFAFDSLTDGSGAVEGEDAANVAMNLMGNHYILWFLGGCTRYGDIRLFSPQKSRFLRRFSTVRKDFPLASRMVAGEDVDRSGPEWSEGE